MRYKGFVVIFIVIFSIFIFGGCGSRKQEQIVIRIAHASSEDSATQVVCESFANEVKNQLGDRVEVRIYANATLGSEAEMVESLKMGTLDAGTFGRHSAIDSRLDVINLPFLFESDEHIEKVLRGDEGSKVREIINGVILEQGIVTLGWYETGFREITSNVKIETMSDMKGLLIRTPATETLKSSFLAWGASPTAVDLSELYTSLKSGVVSAQENPYQLIETNKLYEVQKYLCVTNHLTIPNQLVFSKKVWDSYPDDVKDVLMIAGVKACETGAKYNISKNNNLLSELSDKMIVTRMDRDSINEMKKISVEEIWPKFAEDVTAKRILDEIEKLK